MKAIKTVCIGAAVAALSAAQFFLTWAPHRLIGVSIGLFLVVFGWKIGWTAHRKFTTLLGHLVVTAGCLVTAYGIYQIPFLKAPPSLLEVIDLPLFWGLFTIFGGFCMITHGYCACAIRMHEENNRRAAGTATARSAP